MLRSVLVALSLGCATAFNAPAASALALRSAAARTVGVALQFGGGKKAAATKLPKGWRKVPSRSRPNAFSYENTKTGERFDRPPNAAGKFGGAVYDDEVDTVSQTPWEVLFARKQKEEPDTMTDMERAGYTADGRDLASAGGEIYLALVPALLLFFLYSNGVFSFGYADGNFKY